MKKWKLEETSRSRHFQLTSLENKMYKAELVEDFIYGNSDVIIQDMGNIVSAAEHRELVNTFYKLLDTIEGEDNESSI